MLEIVFPRFQISKFSGGQKKGDKFSQEWDFWLISTVFCGLVVKTEK